MVTSQNHTLLKTNSQNLERQKSKLREFRSRISELETLNRQKTTQIAQFDEEKRKICKKFEKEQNTWSKTADRFEIDRSKWPVAVRFELGTGKSTGKNCSPLFPIRSF